MKKSEYSELLEELYEMNQLLEMCRGYTQSDNPDMVALDTSLYVLINKYRYIYTRLECNDNYEGVEHD